MLEIKFSTKNLMDAYVYSPLTAMGVRELQRLPRLKYYYVPKRESRFTLGLNAAKNSEYIKPLQTKFVDN